MSIRKKTRKRYSENKKKERRRKNSSRRRLSRKRLSRKRRSRKKYSRKKKTGGSILLEDYAWATIDEEVVNLVRKLMRALNIKEIGNIQQDSISTAHAYIILNYLFHKLRPESSAEGSYSGLHNKYTRKMTMEIDHIEGVKEEVSKKAPINDEAMNSISSITSTATALLFQTLTTAGGIEAVASGVAASAFIASTAGIALIPIITSMLIARRSVASDWDGDVLSNFHLRTGSKSDIVDQLKEFVKRKLLPTLGKEFYFMETQANPKSPLSDLFVEGFKKMVVSKRDQSHDKNKEDIDIMLTKFNSGDKIQQLLISMIYINFFVTFYFKSRSSEVVKEVELLQKRVVALEKAIQGLKSLDSRANATDSESTYPNDDET